MPERDVWTYLIKHIHLERETGHVDDGFASVIDVELAAT